MMPKTAIAMLALLLACTGCATLTNDSNIPVALSFSTGEAGMCKLSNKRQTQQVAIPNTASVRRSDDNLQYDCKTENGNEAVGAIPSTMGSKIVASAVFLDFGIVDSITDKHREYPASFVIPVQNKR
ncbi:MAG: hypothetical protein ACK5IB_02700 [Qingshengfaniella sp.]